MNQDQTEEAPRFKVVLSQAFKPISEDIKKRMNKISERAVELRSQGKISEKTVVYGLVPEAKE